MENFDACVAGLLSEGVHDVNRYKAIFVVGPPGAGKSYVTKYYINDGTLKVVDMDVATEHLVRKQGLVSSAQDMDLRSLSPTQQQQFKDIRDRARTMTKGEIEQPSQPHKSLLQHYLDGGLGMIYAGTGSDLEDIQRSLKFFKDHDYDVMMVVVTAPLEVCLQGNRTRTRKISEDVVRELHAAVQANIPSFKSMFKKDFVEFNNTERGSTSAMELQKTVLKFLRR